MKNKEWLVQDIKKVCDSYDIVVENIDCLAFKELTEREKILKHLRTHKIDCNNCSLTHTVYSTIYTCPYDYHISVYYECLCSNLIEYKIGVLNNNAEKGSGGW